MKGYAMLKIGESGWIEKERPVCGPLDAICRPLQYLENMNPRFHTFRSVRIEINFRTRDFRTKIYI